MTKFGQGRINNPNTPLNANLDNLWALVTKTISHPLHLSTIPLLGILSGKFFASSAILEGENLLKKNDPTAVDLRRRSALSIEALIPY